jgi:putative DNA primase/helicase
LLKKGGKNVSQLITERVIPTLTQFGVTERFVAKYQGKIFYVVDQNCWLYWDEKQFLLARVIIEDLAKQTILAMREELVENQPIKNVDPFKNIISDEDILDFIEYYSGFGGKKSILLNARSMTEMTAFANQFDTHQNKLNVQNGIIDLKTGELIDHDSKFKMRQIANVDYDPEAKSKKWDKFLDDITNGDTELEEYLQRIIGYALTGSTKEQVFFIFVGNGANGKSTFLNVFTSILGDYAQATPTQTLMAKGRQGINTDEARLKGARFVVASEVNQKQKFDVAKVKKLTGGDTVTARFMRQDFFEFIPEFKLFMAVNTLPEVPAEDAIFRRIRIVKFKKQFKDDKLNKDLQKELLEESDAILAWAVEGAVKWFKEGLPYCQKVEDATKVYQQSADILERFISENLTKAPKSKISIGELYETFKTWSAENSERDLNKRELGDLMRAKNFKQGKSGSTRYWRGLDLQYRVPTKEE